MKTYIIGITGASGSAYALRTVEALLRYGAALRIAATDMGRKVLEYETGRTLEAWAAGWGAAEIENNADLFSPIASGSFPCAGMAVVPCSMSTLGKLAGGITPDLLTRAADVTLKQKRPLVLVPRETPLSPIHLQNMLALANCGVQIIPAMPGFYSHPQSIADIISFIAGKILDGFGIENDLYERWRGQKG